MDDLETDKTQFEEERKLKLLIEQLKQQAKVDENASEYTGKDQEEVRSRLDIRISKVARKYLENS